MEYLSHGLQVASLGAVGFIVAQPDGGHLALAGVALTTLGSIVTAVINSREKKQAREFQAEQLRVLLRANAELTRAAVPPYPKTSTLDDFPKRAD